MRTVSYLVEVIPDALFVISAVFVALVSFFLFRKASGTMSIYRLTIISVTYYVWLLLMFYVGLVLNILGVENYALTQRSDRSIRMAYAAVSYVMLVMPLSMIFYQKVLFHGKIKNKVYQFYSATIKPVQTVKDSAQIYFWSILTVICIGGVIYCYSIVPGTPIFAALSGASALEIAKLRHITTFEFPGNVYVKNLIVAQLTPYVSYVAFIYYKLYNKNSLRVWFYITFLLAVLALLYTTEVKPIALYVVGFVLIKGIISRGLSTRLIVYIIIGAITAILMMSYLTDGLVPISFYGGPLSRLVMVQSNGLAAAFEVFPKGHEFLYGASLPEWMLPLFNIDEQVKAGRLLMKINNPEGVRAGTAGRQVSLFVMEAYANFGLAGLYISPLLVGFVLQSVHNIVLSLRKNPLTVSLMVMFMVGIPIISGFFRILWNVALIFVVVVTIISILWRKALVEPHV